MGSLSGRGEKRFCSRSDLPRDVIPGLPDFCPIGAPCIRFPVNFSEFSVAVPRIGTGSEVGLCVDAAEKLDKKAQNQSISLKDLFSNNKR